MSGGQGNVLFGKGKLSAGPRNVAIDTRNDLISLVNVPTAEAKLYMIIILWSNYSN